MNELDKNFKNSGPTGPNRVARRQAVGKKGESKWRPGSRGRPPKWTMIKASPGTPPSQTSQTSQIESPIPPTDGGANVGDLDETVPEPSPPELKSAWQFASSAPERDTPPREAEEQAPASPVKLNAREQQLANNVAQMYVLIGTGLFLADQYDGILVMSGGPDRARELVVLSRTNKQVKRALEILTTWGAWTAVIVGHSTMTIPILIHHRLMPPRVAVAVGIDPATIPLAPVPAGRARGTSGPSPARPPETPIPGPSSDQVSRHAPESDMMGQGFSVPELIERRE